MNLRLLARLILLLILFIFLSGCAEPVAAVVAKYIIYRVDNMAPFVGDAKVYADMELRMRIYYLTGLKFIVELQEPDTVAGEKIFYDGTSFLFFSPVKKRSVLFKGLNPVPREELEKYVRKSLIDAYRNINLRRLDGDLILEREVLIYEGTPRQSKEFSFKHTSWIDKEQYIPLKQVSYMWPNNFFMSFEYTNIDFEADIAPDLKNINLGEGINEVVVDYGQEGISDFQEAKNMLGFSPLKPDILPEDITIDQMRTVTGRWPIFTIYLKSEIYHVLLAQSVKGPPLPVEGWRTIRIDDIEIEISNYFGLYLFQFKKKGIYHAAFGNLTFDKMMELIRGL